MSEAFGLDLTPGVRWRIKTTPPASPRVLPAGYAPRTEAWCLALREGRDTAAVVDESLMGYYQPFEMEDRRLRMQAAGFAVRAYSFSSARGGEKKTVLIDFPGNHKFAAAHIPGATSYFKR